MLEEKYFAPFLDMLSQHYYYVISSFQGFRCGSPVNFSTQTMWGDWQLELLYETFLTTHPWRNTFFTSGRRYRSPRGKMGFGWNVPLIQIKLMHLICLEPWLHCSTALYYGYHSNGFILLVNRYIFSHLVVGCNRCDQVPCLFVRCIFCSIRPLYCLINKMLPAGTNNIQTELVESLVTN